MNLQQIPFGKATLDASSSSAKVTIDTEDLIELASKGVATTVVIYRFTRCALTHRIASHLLKHTLTALTLNNKTVERKPDSGVTFALYVAAGLKLIARETPEARIMDAATTIGTPIEVALEQRVTDIQRRLVQVGDIWAEELANTPEIAYVHQLPLDDSNFLTYFAEAELAMRQRIRSDIS